MFAKLLKYDLRAVFKYWWMAAVASAIIAALGGICISIVNVDYTKYGALQTIATLGIVLAVIGIVIFFTLSEILVLVRFYKNFYSDEGYLTFTLPVKKSQLLNSKLVMSLVFYVASTIVLAFDALLMLALGFADEFFSAYFWKEFWRVVTEVTDVLGGYTVVYIIEALVAFVVLWLFSALAIFVCLTVSSVLVHKHKVLAAVGIYYVASGVITGVIEALILQFNFYVVFEKIAALPKDNCLAAVAFLILAAIAAVGIGAVGLYMLHSWLLDKKLNLE